MILEPAEKKAPILDFMLVAASQIQEVQCLQESVRWCWNIISAKKSIRFFIGKITWGVLLRNHTVKIVVEKQLSHIKGDLLLENL